MLFRSLKYDAESVVRAAEKCVPRTAEVQSMEVGQTPCHIAKNSCCSTSSARIKSEKIESSVFADGEIRFGGRSGSCSDTGRGRFGSAVGIEVPIAKVMPHRRHRRAGSLVTRHLGDGMAAVRRARTGV